MDLFAFMDLLKPFEDALHDEGNDVLGDGFVVAFNEHGETSCVHVLDEHEQRLSIVVGEMILHDIRRLT